MPVAVALPLYALCAQAVASAPTQLDLVRQTIAATEPLRHPRGRRLPLYLWNLIGLGTDDPGLVRQLLRELDERGLAAFATWTPRDRERSLAAALALSRAQHELGLDVNINAIACLYSFCNGDPSTAHVDDQGQPFFDRSQASQTPIGCPFALAHRHAAIREQTEFFAAAYQRAGIPIRFVFSDWEIDGPMAWNEAWAQAKRCVRCRRELPDLDHFAAFARTVHALRAKLQRECYTEPIRARFPQALVGNYAVYPNDGWRYWYDYFEQEPAPGLPWRPDQRAKVRPWPDEWSATGYTYAMPVVYTWYPTFGWYDYANPDYRWFYNLLQNGTNAAKSTAPHVPVVSFVHWHTTSPPKQADPAVKQMSAPAYQELLWHLLLRGHAGLFLWSPRDEAIEETRLLHQVYAASLEYREFLEAGTPVSYAVPEQQGPAVSGLRLGQRVLVRRTDFDAGTAPIALDVAGQRLAVPRLDGKCQVLTLAEPY